MQSWRMKSWLGLSFSTYCCTLLSKRSAYAPAAEVKAPASSPPSSVVLRLLFLISTDWPGTLELPWMLAFSAGFAAFCPFTADFELVLALWIWLRIYGPVPLLALVVREPRTAEVISSP